MPPKPLNYIRTAVKTTFVTAANFVKTVRRSLWKGPVIDGITFSMLSKFICCRERFRMHVVEGVREARDFDATVEYGNLWHAAEEAVAMNREWLAPMKAHYTKLLSDYVGRETDIVKWYTIAKGTFPMYLEHWKKNDPDARQRVPVLAERVFSVMIRLPSGRSIRLRGKIDSVFRILWGLYVMENKTKGKIDELGLQKTVANNLQTLIYVTVLNACLSADAKGNAVIDLGNGDKKLIIPKQKKPIIVQGVLYNVHRRPLGDNRAIKRKKTETEAQFYKRLFGNIAKEPAYSFLRWKINLTPADLNRFCGRTLYPILEQVLDWWESIENDPFNPWIDSRLGDVKKIIGAEPTPNKLHWQTPWGVYNSLFDGVRGNYFDYLTSANAHQPIDPEELPSSLQRVEELFPELK